MPMGHDQSADGALAQKLERAVLGEGLRFSRRRDLLAECLGWSGAAPFQRLEYLGDALLEFIVSTELCHRFPHLGAGDLTELRSAHVNNRRLAELLVRRLGKPLAHELFPAPSVGGGDGEAAKWQSIHDFIEGVDLEASSTIASLASHHHERLKQRRVPVHAEGSGAANGSSSGAAATPEGGGERGGESTPIKRVGDMYEALVGLVLLELGGDVDRMWDIFRCDLFPDACSREACDAVLHGIKQTKAEQAARQLKHELGLQIKAETERALLDAGPLPPVAVAAMPDNGVTPAPSTRRADARLGA